MRTLRLSMLTISRAFLYCLSTIPISEANLAGTLAEGASVSTQSKSGWSLWTL